MPNLNFGNLKISERKHFPLTILALINGLMV